MSVSFAIPHLSEASLGLLIALATVISYLLKSTYGYLFFCKLAKQLFDICSKDKTTMPWVIFVYVHLSVIIVIDN